MSESTILNLSTFVLGCAAGWFSNHWYAVNIREPKLKSSGSGMGSSFKGTGYKYTYSSIQNELRFLGFNLPQTVILGKQVKTRYGNKIIERDPARECRAALLDGSKKFICSLWWEHDGKIIDSVEIKPNQSINLLTFIRKEDDSNKYFAYQPISQSDFSPHIAKSPTFSETKNFFINISYMYGSKKLLLPVRVDIKYDGNFYVETDSGSSLF